MNAKQWVVAISLVSAVLVGWVVTISTPELVTSRFSPLETGLIAIAATLDAGAVILFASGLRAYKTKMKFAYSMLAIAVVLSTLATLQFPLVDRFDLWDASWIRYGGAIIPYIVSALLVYLSMRAFAKLVGVHGWLTHSYVVVPLGVLIAIGVIFLPHVANQQPEAEFDAGLMVQAWGGAFNLAAALLVLKVRKGIGGHYQRAVTWLMAVLFGATSAFTLNIVHSLVSPTSTDAVTLLLYVLAAFVGGLWLAAGYAFAQTKDY